MSLKLLSMPPLTSLMNNAKVEMFDEREDERRMKRGYHHCTRKARADASKAIQTNECDQISETCSLLCSACT